MIEHLTCVVPATLAARTGFDQEKLSQFEKVTGIKKTRRWYSSTSSFIDRAVREFKSDVARQLYSKTDIGCVVLVTQSPDRLSPCLAIDVHKMLGLDSSVPAFDVNQSCDGFVYGVWLAQRACPIGKRGIVVCVDRLRFHEGTMESLIFSDAACVAVVTRGVEEPKFLNDGAGASVLFANMDGKMEMDGGAVFDFVTKNIPGMVASMGFYDYFCPHQANLSMLKLLERRCQGAMGKTLLAIEEYGNASMVSIPLALAHNEEKILGKRVLMCGFGAGWSAASLITPWSQTKVSKIVEV